MSLPQPKSRPAQGGSFLFEPTGRGRIFAPEQFTEEHRLIYQTALDFTVDQVLPHVEELETKQTDRMVRLMKEAGQLGLLGTDVPEAYGGLGGDKVTSMLLAEAVSRYASWATTFMAHTGIGTLPIVCFGTEEQKQRYLPQLASGEWIGAYALTEPGSGSDALAAKARAVPTADGDAYLLTGTKQFITNGSWADLFVVFAQVETAQGPRFTCFLVERTFPGVSLGAEEHKLGLHGSSTCALVLEEVRVPRDNVLGEVGKGHKIAFNILNVGRWKLGAGSVGGCKALLGEGVKYAEGRKQFGRPLSAFGAIRKKLAQAAAYTFAIESMAYRVAGLTDDRIAVLDPAAADHDRRVVEAIEEYAIESSILKVAGSEALATVVDEMLQVFGGYGFLEEYPPARVYRDNRINRIFEGTNEINRLLVPGVMLKRAMGGLLPLMPAFAAAEAASADTSPIAAPADAVAVVDAYKRATVFALGLAVGRYMTELSEQQQVLESLADAIIFCFALDSCWSRTLQLEADAGPEAAGDHRLMARVYAREVGPRLAEALRTVVGHVAEEADRPARLAALGRLLPISVDDLVELRVQLAERVVAQGGYPLLGG